MCRCEAFEKSKTILLRSDFNPQMEDFGKQILPSSNAQPKKSQNQSVNQPKTISIQIHY